MIELEFQILSDRREGLLVELGRLVVASGYTLLRQRLSQDHRGTWLIMLVRGPSERQLALEEGLATHNRVLSFEAALAGAASTPLPPASMGTAPPAMVQPAPIPVSPMVTPPPARPTAAADVRQVEAVLPQLARDYPKIYPWLLTLEHSVADQARASSLLLAGQRTGAWVFKRDFAMGAKLPLADAVKRIALPALRELAAVDWRDGQLHIQNSPLCLPGGHAGCHFFVGYLEGVLSNAVGKSGVYVRCLHCRSDGAPACVIDVSD